jgi:hypothetical protein
MTLSSLFFIWTVAHVLGSLTVLMNSGAQRRQLDASSGIEKLKANSFFVRGRND